MKPIFLVFALAACAPAAVTSPAQREARAAAAYEYTARNCPSGFGDAVAIRQQAEKRYAAAKQLGATDAMIQEERATVANAVAGAAVWVGEQETCQKLISEAAMNAS